MSDSHTKQKPTSAKSQATRINRLIVAGICHLGSFLAITLMALVGLIHWGFAVFIFVCSALTIAVFYWMIKSGFNLKFTDPNLSVVQILAAYFPPAVAMFFVDSGQARALFVLIALIPIVFGVFILSTRQFIIIGLVLLAIYTSVTLSLITLRPEVLSTPEEIVQAFIITLMVAEISIIGSFVTKLRNALRQRNNELNEALVKIQDMANKDEITGLYNRRYLFEHLRSVLREAQLDKTPFCLSIIDLDNFKKINELHGFQQGDSVLRRVTECMLRHKSSDDCLGRYVSGNYLLIQPRTDLETAQIKADAMRENIARLEFPELGADFRASVSIGIAEYHVGEEIEATINRADLALYEAKSLGRNHCVVKEWYSA